MDYTTLARKMTFFFCSVDVNSIGCFYTIGLIKLLNMNKQKYSVYIIG